MASPTSRGIPLSSVSPWYLHTNSTSHTWPFSAIAELIDNAYDPDVNAKQFWIDKTMIKEQDCLIFMDNGNGMDYNKMLKMLSFGFSAKPTVKDRAPVGLYGNGFKSGSMRLGKDAIVFSKKANTMCVGLLSQTYLEKIKAQNVVVPIAMFTNTVGTISAVPEHEECLNDILTHSLFNTKKELLSEFSVIDGLCTKSSGTRIIIWDLRRRSSGELEFDFIKDSNDIQIPVDMYESTEGTQKKQLDDVKWMPESKYSLRAYCSILYLKPKMQIIIQGQKVQTQFVTKNLANVFNDTYKPVYLKKGIKITFGYNTKNKEHYGLMMYNKNRLIKAYERVPCQRKVVRTGVGVIGVIECDFLTPTHNKQDFDNTEEYRKIMLSVGNKLEEYWKEVRYRLKKNLNCTEPAEDIVLQPDQTWVQCDDCLTWRKLPDCIQSKKLPKNWYCRMNSDPQFRSCTAEGGHADSDDEQPRYQKTYKKDERKQKLQEQKIQEDPSTPSSCIQVTKPFDDDASTPKRKKNTSSLSQENPEKKKARRKGSDSIKPGLSTSSSPACVSNKAGYKDVKTALKGDSDDLIDGKDVKSMMKNEQINQTTQNSSEDQQNNKVLQIMEEINQLQQQVEYLKKHEKKDFEEVKSGDKKMDDTKDRSRRETGWGDNNTLPQFCCSYAGQFQCKLTNLVFEMKGKGEVIYTVESWDKSQLQGMGQFQPAGPLYSIKCSEDSVQYLHLPHCEIQPDKNQIELAVAHVNEGNMEILQPVKVTDTHVIVKVQHLSLYGLLKKIFFRETPISAQVLFFYQDIQFRKKLHIHLLPGNVPVKEVQNQHKDSTYIRCSSICQLTPGKKYRPFCMPYVSQPKIETFAHDFGPNYHPTFELILNTEVTDIRLSLLDDCGQEVWEPRAVILTADSRDTAPVEPAEAAEFIDKHMAGLIQRVQSVMEIADILLTKKIISYEMYNTIAVEKTSQDKMRTLYGFIKSNENDVKAEFFKVLKEKECSLVNYLKTSR